MATVEERMKILKMIEEGKMNAPGYLISKLGLSADQTIGAFRKLVEKLLSDWTGENTQEQKFQIALTLHRMKYHQVKN